MNDAVSMWSSIASWFTPTVLFCVLNLMIGTIFLTSNFKTHHRKTEDDHQHDHNPSAPGPLYRAPSLLERVRSLNFNHDRSEFPNPVEPDTHQTAPLFRAPSLLERVRTFNFNLQRSEYPSPSEPNNPQTGPLFRAPSLLERVRSINFNPYRSDLPNASEPETHQADSIHRAEDNDTRAPVAKLDRNRPARLKKSASEKQKAEEAEEVDRRRPMTVRERQPKPMVGDVAVDAKADDFINRFKNQLKLQRLDSILRYKEMLHRGASR